MIWTAFFLGILGSMHCIGMCGPIALALPVPKNKNRYMAISLYNVGRVLMYGILGLLFGGFGSIFVMAGLQQFLSIMAGVMLLIILAISLGQYSTKLSIPVFSSVLIPLKSRLGYHLKKYSVSSLFIIGLLNGLLPCGLVYMAIISAIATGNPMYGSYYMMLFGFGTVPAMFMVSILKNNISDIWRLRLKKTFPFGIAIISIILIIRGMNLGIPYLSPEISSEKPILSHCCTKK